MSTRAQIAPELDRNGEPRKGWWIVTDPDAAVPALSVSGSYLDVEAFVVTRYNLMATRLFREVLAETRRTDPRLVHEAMQDAPIDADWRSEYRQARAAIKFITGRKP